MGDIFSPALQKVENIILSNQNEDIFDSTIVN